LTGGEEGKKRGREKPAAWAQEALKPYLSPLTARGRE